jgi:hypothetical protein
MSENKDSLLEQYSTYLGAASTSPSAAFYMFAA